MELWWGFLIWIVCWWVFLFVCWGEVCLFSFPLTPNPQGRQVEDEAENWEGET